MNDLYWFNGANLELKSENGNLFELEFRKEHTFPMLEGPFEGRRIFHSIEDMIVCLQRRASGLLKTFDPVRVKEWRRHSTAVRGRSWKGSWNGPINIPRGLATMEMAGADARFPEHRLRMQGHLAYRRTHLRLALGNH